MPPPPHDATPSVNSRTCKLIASQHIIVLSFIESYGLLWDVYASPFDGYKIS